MPIEGRTILLDVTRLILRSWTARRPTGIDRVCYAYLRHYRERALAVVQLRGRARVLDARHSSQLFDMLLAPSRGFRREVLAFAPGALIGALPEGKLAGSIYINTGHTDFDFDAHHDWVRRSGVRSIYFIHDLIPILHPEFTRPLAVRRCFGRLRGALRSGAGIIVSSRVVVSDLENFARSHGHSVPPLSIVPIAGETLASVAPAQSLAHPYFLSVATVEPRKNHSLLFDVWRGLAARMGEAAPRLILVGQEGPLTRDILEPARSDPILAELVELRPRCSDRELAGLMVGAEAMLMPSLAEGFGLPMVEALQSGMPVIAADTPIFREIGQGAPLLLDPRDPAPWAEAIERHAEHPLEARPHFEPPNWSEHFRQIDAWIETDGLKTARTCESSLAA